MMLYQNVAGQHIGFAALNVVFGAITGTSGFAAYCVLDGAAQVAATGTVSDMGHGQYSFALSAADTFANNGSIHFTMTGMIPVEKTYWTRAVTTGGYTVGMDPATQVLAAVSTDWNMIGTVGGSIYTSGGYGITQNQFLPNFPFVMVDSNGDLLIDLTVTSTVSIDGAAPVSTTNNATEVGEGGYKITLSADDLNGLTIMLFFSAPGAVTNVITIITQT